MLRIFYRVGMFWPLLLLSFWKDMSDRSYFRHLKKNLNNALRTSSRHVFIQKLCYDIVAGRNHTAYVNDSASAFSKYTYGGNYIK